MVSPIIIIETKSVLLISFFIVFSEILEIDQRSFFNFFMPPESTEKTVEVERCPLNFGSSVTAKCTYLLTTHNFLC